jgi:glycine oxidase
MRPLTVQSALELLSAACTVHPGFAEGTILENRVNCRPALPDNLPSIIFSKNGSRQIISVNGLYRHGFLLSPKLAKLVLNYLADGEIDLTYKQLFVERKGEKALAISH